LNRGRSDHSEGNPGHPSKESSGRKAEGPDPLEPECGQTPVPIPEAVKRKEVSPQPGGAPKAPATSLDATAEISKLRAKLEEKEAQIVQIMKAYRGLKKENEKVRQRMEQNQKRHLERSKSEFIGQFVDVLDNLDRAIESIENAFDVDSVLQGIILLRSRLVQLLRQEGLEKIFVGGQPFDPTHSEAAGIEPVESEAEDNIVMHEIQRGYMLRGTLLRPARVVVGRFAGHRINTDDDPTSNPPDNSPTES
jgi:molecular chaperone GrpE